MTNKVISFENKKTFNTVDTIPHSLNCPANVYNLWKTWDYEKYENEYLPNLDDLLFIQNHIRTLCNYQEEIYEYVVDWLAQMIQFPHIKTTMLLFLSKEGVGKGLFLALIEKIILDDNMRMPVSRLRASRRSKAYPENISLFDVHYSSFSIFLE